MHRSVSCQRFRMRPSRPSASIQLLATCSFIFQIKCFCNFFRCRAGLRHGAYSLVSGSLFALAGAKLPYSMYDSILSELKRGIARVQPFLRDSLLYTCFPALKRRAIVRVSRRDTDNLRISPSAETSPGKNHRMHLFSVVAGIYRSRSGQLLHRDSFST